MEECRRLKQTQTLQNKRQDAGHEGMLWRALHTSTSHRSRLVGRLLLGQRYRKMYIQSWYRKEWWMLRKHQSGKSVCWSSFWNEPDTSGWVCRSRLYLYIQSHGALLRPGWGQGEAGDRTQWSTVELQPGDCSFWEWDTGNDRGGGRYPNSKTHRIFRILPKQQHIVLYLFLGAEMVQYIFDWQVQMYWKEV